MQITHNNHFVSQSYLKRWSTDGKRLWCYKILVSSENVPMWQQKSVRSVGIQSNLYTEVKEGNETDEFEKWLDKDFESPAHDVIEKAIRQEILSSSDWDKLVLFLAAQDLRTPQNYFETVERWNKDLPSVLENSLEKIIKELEQGKRHEPSFEQDDYANKHLADSFKISIIKDYEPERKLGAIKVELTPNRQLWIKQQRFLLEKTAKKLLEHHWSIAKAPEGFIWITSDHPVIRLNYYGNGDYDFKGGWGKENGNVIMPISPKHLLITQIGKRWPNYIQFSPNLTSQFNKFLAERAFRSIFSLEPISTIEKIRPRIVDECLFREEQRDWREWHYLQTESEIN